MERDPPRIEPGQLEEGLIGLLAEGDRDAWEAFHRRLRPIIRAAARGVLRAHGDATAADDEQDVVQEVFRRLIGRDFRLLRTFDGRKGALSSWLARVSRCTALNFLKRRRTPTIPLEEAPDLPAPARAAPPALPEIPPGLLTPRETRVLRLSVVEDLSPAEIAKALGITRATVYVVRYRAVSKLRRFFCAKPKE